MAVPVAGKSNRDHVDARTTSSNPTRVPNSGYPDRRHTGAKSEPNASTSATVFLSHSLSLKTKRKTFMSS
jgi:hypothetical protein